MTGLLLQINRSGGGLPKRPVSGPVMLTREGVQGDRHRNLKYHGGPDKAVLMLAAEKLAELRAGGFQVIAGSLGENFTVEGLDHSRWRAGQRYRIGENAVIELTTLRTPCLNLDVYDPAIRKQLYDAKCRAGNPETPRWAGGGFYARVIHEGLLIAGAPITLESENA
jgi:MOSC domain-containing protein YiiM